MQESWIINAKDQGIEQNSSQAKEAFAKSCNLGDKGACEEIKAFRN